MMELTALFTLEAMGETEVPEEEKREQHKEDLGRRYSDEEYERNLDLLGFFAPWVV